MAKPILSKLRKDYHNGELSESALAPNPLELFREWFGKAVESGVHEPNAMALATAGDEGIASVRMVLLKDYDEKGLVFFTNYHSRKGKEIQANPQVTLLFWWGKLARQIRIEGRAEKIDPAESDAYFQSRPREAQIGAWASQQSDRLESREILERRIAEFSAQFANRVVPRPPHWGGYRVRPEIVEFWQGRTNRLHDRFRYTRVKDRWKIERLFP